MKLTSLSAFIIALISTISLVEGAADKNECKTKCKNGKCVDGECVNGKCVNGECPRS